MKYYYYILYRIFNSLSDQKKHNNAGTISILLTNTSTLIVWFGIYTMLLYIDYYCFNISNILIPNQFFVLIYVIILALLNYYFFIKDKRFLNYGFEADKKGGYFIVGFIILMAVSFVFIANKNREKISNEREKVRIENRDAFSYDTFIKNGFL
ncbi:hypothetical protein CLU81_3671 [Flavobacterium sp. 9]|uniref:hypothetical protein n=1 Tax=Flavobacterium sp. 9 TaxID=2035198 RepID=UPI000C185C7C|nr:hypothetical protein [Flavobacterium sp. 9]PIF33097.1 hypothetical protein CLU81_3671 [Flavobacterium sp. 9]